MTGDTEQEVTAAPSTEEANGSLPAKERAPYVVLVTGEPSGDALGGQLMAALKTLTRGHIRFDGVGGEAMAAEGLRSLFPITDTSVMGLKEVFPALPRIFKRVHQTAGFIMEAKPDVVVLIDCPGFTHRIAKRLAARAPEIKVVKYVAPQVWASRPHRAAQLAAIADCVLTLFPFEPPWFTREGMKAHFVGNPVVERAPQVKGGAAFRKEHAIAPDAPLLALLPGSRTNEIGFLLPVFREAVVHLKARIEGLQTVIPMVPHMVERIAATTQDWPTRLHLVHQTEKFAAFDAANVALAASGTVTTELALAHVPMVVAYKVGWITAAVYRNLIKVPFITLINILQGRGVVPEFLQEAVDPLVLADELEILFTEPSAAEVQIAEQQSALVKMGLGDESPSMRAARVVLGMLTENPSPRKGMKVQRQARKAAMNESPNLAAL